MVSALRSVITTRISPITVRQTPTMAEETVKRWIEISSSSCFKGLGSLFADMLIPQSGHRRRAIVWARDFAKRQSAPHAKSAYRSHSTEPEYSREVPTLRLPVETH